MRHYHDVYSKLPAGHLYRGGNGKPNYGWAVAILPYLEQDNFYKQLDPINTPLYNRYKSGASATDKQLLQTKFAAYRCPSDTGPDLAASLKFGATDHFDVAVSNYVACAGWGGKPVKDEDSGGMFYGQSDLPLLACTDGTSNTIMVSERRYRNDHAATWVGVGKNDNFGSSDTLRSLFRATFGMNFNYIAAGSPENAGKGWSSEHTGGVNIVLVDGSVRFLSETTDKPNVLQWMSLRSDGNPVQVP